jgi:hypothetical protein
LTDGQVHRKDKKKTIREVIRASSLPVSIIIVGMGKSNNEFAFMDKLDSDDKFLFGKDKRGQRI